MIHLFILFSTIKKLSMLTLYLERSVVNSDVLKMVRYETKHRERLSNNVFTDAAASKQVMDRLIVGKKFNGFVREVGLDPFGFLLIAEIQVFTNFPNLFV